MPNVPQWLLAAVGITALQAAIRSAISTHALRPAARVVQGAAREQRVSRTSLLHVLDDSRRTAAGGNGGAAQQQMAVQEALGGAPVAQQQQQSRAQAAARARVLEATPEPVVAGPSHSQLAKDHPDSPFFGLAVTLATVADRRLRGAIIGAWSEARGQPSTPSASPGRPADPGLATLYDERMADMRSRQERGAAIERQGRELPAGAYDLASLRLAEAERVRAIAGALRGVAATPDQAAAQLEVLRRSLGGVPVSPDQLTRLEHGIDELRRGLQAGGSAVSQGAGLSSLADRLEADATRIAAAGRSPTLVEREQTNAALIASRSQALQAFGSAPSVDRGLAALSLFALDEAIASTSPAYEQHQRDVLERRAHVDGVTRQDVATSQINLPAIADRPPALRALLAESRRIVGHPYDDAWWVPTVTTFVRSHSAQIAAEVTARNRGYSTFGRR